MPKKKNLDGSFWRSMRQAERNIITFALEQKHSVADTAAILGISTNFLTSLITKHEIDIWAIRGEPKPTDKSVEPQTPIIKRGRGRPRKNPLPLATEAPIIRLPNQPIEVEVIAGDEPLVDSAGKPLTEVEVKAMYNEPDDDEGIDDDDEEYEYGEGEDDEDEDEYDRDDDDGDEQEELEDGHAASKNANQPPKLAIVKDTDAEPTAKTGKKKKPASQGI